MKRLPIAAAAALLLASCGLNSPDLNEGSVRAGFKPANDLGGGLSSVLYAAPGGAVSPIKANQMMMISLISGYICDFRENAFSINPLAATNRGSSTCGTAGFFFDTAGVATRGEVAITAAYNVRGSDSSDNEPRIIYYNDDVRESGQLFNFQNIPIYGPFPAPQASSVLTLNILELDAEENQETSAVLAKLSQLGQGFGSPLSGSVFGALTSVGQAFVSSNEDDREFAFEMGFDPAQPTSDPSSVHRNSLREGYYAVLRKERRDRTDHFRNLVICPERGVLVPGSSAADCQTDAYYNRDTWLLLRVSREDKNAVKAQYRERLLADLLAANEGGGTPDLSAFDTLVNSLFPTN